MLWWLALALLLVIGLTWLVVWLLHGPWALAIAVTVGLVVVFLLVLIVRRALAALRAAALEREMERAAAQHAANLRPDRREEVLALQKQMASAIASLKRTKLGTKGGKSALYSLPWYVVIGPPRAGKTTALVQSELHFVTPPGGGAGKFRGTAGTRNCDWWFSDRAILLDTAGRFVTGEDDREEWLGFLDLVRKFRPQRPLDGVVLALSVEDVLNAGEFELEELATGLRNRVNEVLERLEMTLPVYLMLTKADLIAGFVEFWGDLSKSQRGQAWGASFELGDDSRDTASAVDREFERLEQVLYARLFQRLTSEPLADVRARALQFPLELAGLRAPLVRLTEYFCRENPYQETPLLRGFFLTSGTQTGLAIDRVLEHMQRGFNVPLLQAGSASRASTPQSYFVTELFQRVIFPDRHLAVRSRSRLRRRARTQAIQAVVVALVALALVIPAAASYVDNSQLIHATSRDIARSVELERAPRADSAATAEALDLLVGRVETLEQAARAFQIHGYLGPYTAPDLITAVKRVYLERLRALVHGPVKAELDAEVRSAGTGPAVGHMDSQNFQQDYEALKLYLMLGRPEHLAPDWAAPALARVWARGLRSEASGDQSRLLAHARYFVSELGRDKSWALSLDEAAVARAQGRLAAVPIDELRYGWLLDAAKGAPPIRPDSIFLGSAAQYSSAKPNAQVPGAYTALGWQKIRALVDSPDARLELEPWVLGQVTTPDTDTRASAADRLRELYFQRYTRAWVDFIAGLGVLPPTDVQSAIEELRVLSVPEGPYARLFNVLGENVRLDVTPPTSLLDLAKQKATALAESAIAQVMDGGPPDGGTPDRTISPPEREFKPLLEFGFVEPTPGKLDAARSGLQQYLDELRSLEVVLSDLAENKAAPAQGFDTALERTQAAVKGLLGRLDARTYRILEPLLMNPIRGSRAGVMRADFTQLSEHWKTEVWDPLHEKITPRYPFSDVPAELSTSELAEFFRPDAGLVWKFFTDNLAGRLDRSGNRYSPKAAADALPFRPDFLECLNVAAEITDAVFGNSPTPSVRFDVQIHPASSDIAEISLIVDGHPTVYRNEPERWVPIEWPGKDAPHGATLLVRGAGFTDQIPRTGDFGLFRLFEVGGLKPAGGGGPLVLTGAWTLTRTGEAPVTIDVRPGKSVHPFTRGFFRRMNKCPPAVTTLAATGSP